jgi:hypothetical protein
LLEIIISSLQHATSHGGGTVSYSSTGTRPASTGHIIHTLFARRSMRLGQTWLNVAANNDNGNNANTF